MTNKIFKSKQIKLIEDEIRKTYKLTPQYMMSTSGEFFVKTYNRKQKTYLLKIRKINTPEYRLRFLREVYVNRAIYKKNITGLRKPLFMKANIDKKPEFLFYELIPGIPLNTYYFYTGARQEKNLLSSGLFKIIKEIQKKIKVNDKLKFKKFYFEENYKLYIKYEKYLKKYLTSDNLKRIKVVLNKNKKYLNNSNLVLTHGDLNPKNIILQKNNPAIIDWSDVHLNNPLFDLCVLYMHAWNIPKTGYKIKKFINTNYFDVENADKLYLLNRIILTPKIIKIAEDSIKGLTEDRKNKIILPITHRKLTKKAKLAIQTHLTNLIKIVEHLELWQRPIPIIKSIDKFCNTKFIKLFLKQEKKSLGINFKWDSFSVKRLRLAIRHGDQKLITQYTLQNKAGREKIIMAKIRMERGDDLAKQSYKTVKTIWNNKKTRHMVSKPLNYYKKFNLYLYDKTVGESIAQLVENNKISDQTLKKYIKQAGIVLAELHNINANNFKDVKFVNNYGLNEQLKWLNFYLHKISALNTKKNHLTIQIIKEKIKKYLNNSDKTFIHGDFQLQNLIVNKGIIKLIDFDNAEINDPLLDVGNFLNQLNYKNLLPDKADDLRKIFLNSYLKNYKLLDKTCFIQKLNIYVIMGIVKNINFNCLEGDYDIAKHDMKKIILILKNLNKNVLINLKKMKKLRH